MGKRTHQGTRAVLGFLLSGGVKVAQFGVNTGRSVWFGAKDAIEDVKPLETYRAKKPQATKRR